VELVEVEICQEVVITEEGMVKGKDNSDEVIKIAQVELESEKEVSYD
jgi:hypothetical protein